MLSNWIKNFIRSAGRTAAGVALAQFTSSPWGLLLTPVLHVIVQQLVAYYQGKNEPIPAWLHYLPF